MGVPGDGQGSPRPWGAVVLPLGLIDQRALLGRGNLIVMNCGAKQKRLGLVASCIAKRTRRYPGLLRVASDHVFLRRRGRGEPGRADEEKQRSCSPEVQVPDQGNVFPPSREISRLTRPIS